LAQNAFNAWNRHDAKAIPAAYAEGAVYIVPSVPEPLHGGAAVAEYAKVVWTIFPDFSLEVVRIDDLGGGRVAFQWVAHGTKSRRYIRRPHRLAKLGTLPPSICLAA
jgi:hypothetical protein